MGWCDVMRCTGVNVHPWHFMSYISCALWVISYRFGTLCCLCKKKICVIDWQSSTEASLLCRFSAATPRFNIFPFVRETDDKVVVFFNLITISPLAYAWMGCLYYILWLLLYGCFMMLLCPSQLWSVKDGALLKICSRDGKDGMDSLHGGWVTDMHFSPDNSLLVSTGGYIKVR